MRLLGFILQPNLPQLTDQIQPQTIDLSTRFWVISYRVCGVYSSEPRSEVYCLRLNFNISGEIDLLKLFQF